MQTQTTISVLWVRNESGAMEKVSPFTLRADAINAAQELAYTRYGRIIEHFTLDGRTDFFDPDGKVFARIAPQPIDDYSRIDELKARLAVRR